MSWAREHPWAVTGALLLGTAAAAWVAAGLGSSGGQLVFDPGWAGRLEAGAVADGVPSQVIVFLRLPRVVAALLVGAALATAGLLLQGVTRNPLADPYLLGISGGAGLAVVATQAFPAVATRAGWWAVPIAAFVGASLAMLVVLQMARGSGGRLSVLSLILAGVVINALCGALMSFMLARFDPFRLRITTTWLYGGIGFSRWSQLVAVALVLGLCWVLARARAHQLNALALGSEGAAAVGVDAERLLPRTALLASVLAALGVSLGGLLGYIGLVVPHAVRLLVGADLRATLPAAAAAGSLLLVVADTAARVLFAPEELPAGVLTALVGCPVLLLLLRAQLKGGQR